MNLTPLDMATSKIQAKKTLLWTNPAPTSSFSAQTISSIDFSGYDEVEIEFIFNAADTTVRLFNKIQVGSKGMLFAVRAQPFYTQYREVTINSNSVVFDNCVLGTGATYNDHDIPYKIYGIK